MPLKLSTVMLWAALLFVPQFTFHWGHFVSPSSGLGEGNGTPLRYSCLENPMDVGAWQATVHGITKSWTLLSNFTHSLTGHLDFVSHLSAGQGGHVLLSVAEENEREGKHVSAIAGFTFTITFLTKPSHMTEPRVRLGGHSQGLR